MTASFTKTYEKLKRQSMRLTIHRIWNMIKEGNVDDLTQEELKLAVLISSLIKDIQQWPFI